MGVSAFCGGRGLWGPSGSHEDHRLDPNWDASLDFSTCFEDTVLTALPTAFLVLVGGLRLWVLLKWQSYPAPASSLHTLRLFTSFLLFLTMLGEMCVALYDQNYDFRIVSPAIQAFGYVCAMVLLVFERKKNVLSSGVLAFFWLLVLIVDAVRMRTIILQGEHGHLTYWLLGFFGPRVFFDIASFVLAALKDSPSPAAHVADENPCPEQFATLWSIISFWWMTPMMFRGYRRTLVGTDLWNLMPHDQATHLSSAFKRAFEKQVRKGKDRASLIIAMSQAFGATFAMAALFKLIQDILAFVSPQLLNYLIDYVTDDNAPAWHGYALATGLFVTAIVQSICLHQYFHRVMKTGMRLRSAIVTAVYSKALVLSNTARQSTTSGEIVNLMSVDAQRFMDLMTYIHMVWSAPLQISLALYFLWQLMGPATLAGLGVMILMIPLNGYIAKKSRDYQKRQMKQKDERIKLMNEILNGIKVLKLYAWESAFGGFIKEIRKRELEVLKSTMYLGAIGMFSWSSAPFFVALVTFLTYTLTGHTLTAQKAFVALALFNLLRFPLAMLPMMVSALVEASVSLKRIRTFLLHDEKDPNNVVRDPAALRDSPFVDRNGDVLPALFVDRGTFAWKEDKPVLHDITFEILPNTCTAVVGRVGTGKSSLVSALHGDMERISGRVVLPGSVAYVPQQAWIRNATLRDNILFGKVYDEERYERVLRACALEDDLAQLPGGDQTEIGEKGINLSGGQKQRVSLARAVYQDADVYIMDDCLSAVDSHVGKHIFQHVIGPEGCLSGKARLLVTHALHVLPYCDNIIMMRQGRILEQGTYNDLMASGGQFTRLIDEFSAEADSSSSSATTRTGSPSGAPAAARCDAPSASSPPSKQTGKQGEHKQQQSKKNNSSNKAAGGADGAGATAAAGETARRRDKNSVSQAEREDEEEREERGEDERNPQHQVSPAWRNKNAGAPSVQTDETATAPVVVKHAHAAHTQVKAGMIEDIDASSEKTPLLGDSKNTEAKGLINGVKDKIKGTVGLTSKSKKEKEGGASGGGGGPHGSRLIQQEDAMEGGVEWQVYKSYFEAVSYTIIIGLALLYLFTYGFQVGTNFWLSYWSSQDERHQRHSNYTEPLTTGGFLGVYAGLGMLNSLGTYFVALLMAVGSIHASRVFHTRLIDQVMRAPMSFFDTTPMGRILNRFSKDIYVIDETIPRSLRSFMSTFMQVISIIVVISISTPLFMAAVLPLSIVYYYVQKFYVPTSRQLKRLESVSRSPIYAHFSETLAGVSSIRAYQREQSFILENEGKVDTNLQAYYPSVSANRWLALRLEFLGNCIIFFAALFAVLERGTVTGGVVGLSLSYAMSVTQTLNWMVRMSSQLETDIVAIERVEEYCNVKTERPPVMLKRPDSSWPQEGSVQFTNYSVRYREGLDLVLHGISADIRPGEKIGIVGRTGAGKSSLTLALFRILEAADGAITIDGHNIASFGLDDLRSRLTIMPQDPVLFSGTVRRNLDPLSQHSDAELWNALETCHLKDVIAELPKKLDDEVAEGGDNFSVGQRQLMCLARAVLRKTKVLVLDEATAAVDLETDELIQKTIRTVFRDCTILTIAHRLNTILDSDRVMVLDTGRIREFDAPQALMSNRDSIFAGMARAAGITSLPSTSAYATTTSGDASTPQDGNSGGGSSRDGSGSDSSNNNTSAQPSSSSSA